MLKSESSAVALPISVADRGMSPHGSPVNSLTAWMRAASASADTGAGRRERKSAITFSVPFICSIV